MLLRDNIKMEPEQVQELISELISERTVEELEMIDFDILI